MSEPGISVRQQSEPVQWTDGGYDGEPIVVERIVVSNPLTPAPFVVHRSIRYLRELVGGHVRGAWWSFDTGEAVLSIFHGRRGKHRVSRFALRNKTYSSGKVKTTAGRVTVFLGQKPVLT